MRKLIYSMSVSLDGFIAGPGGKIDWSVPDDELFRFHTEQVRELGGHLLGRRLYETMVYWETAEEQPSFPETERASRENLALPFWAGIGADVQERVVAAVRKAVSLEAVR